MREVKSIKQFSLVLMKFSTLKQRSLFSLYEPIGIKLLAGLWLKLSHLNVQKFPHDSKDCASTMCDCSGDIEKTRRLILHFQFFADVSLFRISTDFRNFESKSFISSENWFGEDKDQPSHAKRRSFYLQYY